MGFQLTRRFTSRGLVRHSDPVVGRFNPTMRKKETYRTCETAVDGSNST